MPRSIETYGAIVNFPAGNVSVAVRSQAEVGLGVVAEKSRTSRRKRWSITTTFSMDTIPNHFDPYWVDRAGEFAARLCEDRQQWKEAVRIYTRLIEAVPALRPVLEKKRAAAQSHLEAPRH